MRKITWAYTGVWVRGLTWLTNLGSTPWIDIATATLVHPTITLKTTWSALSMIPMIMRNKRIGLFFCLTAWALNHGGSSGAERPVRRTGGVGRGSWPVPVERSGKDGA